MTPNLRVASRLLKSCPIRWIDMPQVTNWWRSPFECFPLDGCNCCLCTSGWYRNMCLSDMQWYPWSVPRLIHCLSFDASLSVSILLDVATIGRLHFRFVVVYLTPPAENEKSWGVAAYIYIGSDLVRGSQDLDDPASVQDDSNKGGDRPLPKGRISIAILTPDGSEELFMKCVPSSLLYMSKGPTTKICRTVPSNPMTAYVCGHIPCTHIRCYRVCENTLPSLIRSGLSNCTELRITWSLG